MTSTYCRDDIGFEVRAAGSLAAVVGVVFDFFDFQKADPESAPDFVFEAGRGPLPSSNGSEFVDLADDWFGCRISGRGASLLIQKDDWRLLIDGDNASVHLTVPQSAPVDPAKPSADLFVLISFALVYALQRRNCYVLHSAALCDDSGQGIIVMGDSDTGKSTLAMALVREGWNYLSDDSIFVVPEEAYMIARPFRTDFGLDPDAAAVFPEIADKAQPWLIGGEKWRISIRQLFPSRRRDDCVPRLIIFPELTGAEVSTIESMSTSEAIARLLKQGSFLFSQDQADWAKRQLDAFARLGSQCLPFRLLSGTDIMNAPRAFSGMMRGLLAERVRSLPVA